MLLQDNNCLALTRRENECVCVCVCVREREREREDMCVMFQSTGRCIEEGRLWLWASEPK